MALPPVKPSLKDKHRALLTPLKVKKPRKPRAKKAAIINVPKQKK